MFTLSYTKREQQMEPEKEDIEDFTPEQDEQEAMELHEEMMEWAGGAGRL